MLNYLHIASIIFASACIGITFAELSGIPDVIKKLVLPWWNKQDIYKKKYPRRIKPLDCHLCLTFWICLYLCNHREGLDVWVSLALACVAAVTSVLIMKLIRH